MSESPKHTPGPWFYGHYETCRPEFWVIALNPQSTDMSGWRDGKYLSMSGSCLEGDAALISAAPDLLEALKGVLRVADRATVEFDAARAAIAKAEGRP